LFAIIIRDFALNITLQLIYKNYNFYIFWKQATVNGGLWPEVFLSFSHVSAEENVEFTMLQFEN